MLFPFWLDKILCGMYKPHFFHLSINGYLGSFQLLASVKYVLILYF
jgi:hypothetical protein